MRNGQQPLVKIILSELVFLLCPCRITQQRMKRRCPAEDWKKEVLSMLKKRFQQRQPFSDQLKKYKATTQNTPKEKERQWENKTDAIDPKHQWIKSIILTGRLIHRHRLF